MADFINTTDILGEEAVMDSIIDRSITEFKDEYVTTAGYAAFRGCASLETVDLPNATTIGGVAFSGCTSLDAVNLPNVTSCGTAFSGAGSNTLKLYLPNLTKIASYQSFSGANMAEINLPKLASTGLQDFSNCRNLTKAVLRSCNNIDNGAFNTCSKLKWLDVKGGGGFDGNSFNHHYPPVPLKTFIIRNDTTVSSLNVPLGATKIASGTGYIYVPRALIEDYKVATNWSTHASQFRALEDYTVDGTITGELDESKI